MRILKEGHPNETRETCIECECEFLYNKDDIQVEYFEGLFRSWDMQEWVVCPCCQRKIILRTH